MTGNQKSYFISSSLQLPTQLMSSSLQPPTQEFRYSPKLPLLNKASPGLINSPRVFKRTRSKAAFASEASIFRESTKLPLAVQLCFRYSTRRRGNWSQRTGHRYAAELVTPNSSQLQARTGHSELVTARGPNWSQRAGHTYARQLVSANWSQRTGHTHAGQLVTANWSQ